MRRFERIRGKRAEGLDCLVYCFAARSAVPVQWDQREYNLKSPQTPPRTMADFAKLGSP
jgi:phage terminase large subunit GpA-like protein